METGPSWAGGNPSGLCSLRETPAKSSYMVPNPPETVSKPINKPLKPIKHLKTIEKPMKKTIHHPFFHPFLLSVDVPSAASIPC